MSRDKQHGKQISETTITETEVVIQERSAFAEENTTFSQERSPLAAASAAMSSFENQNGPGPAGTATGMPPPATRPRHQGDLSDSQFRLLENLERLAHSLMGPELSLDQVSYNRPFPPTKVRARF